MGVEPAAVAAFVDVVAARTENVEALPSRTADGEIPIDDDFSAGKTMAVKTKPKVIARARYLLANGGLCGSRAMGYSHRAFGTSQEPRWAHVVNLARLVDNTVSDAGRRWRFVRELTRRLI